MNPTFLESIQSTKFVLSMTGLIMMFVAFMSGRISVNEFLPFLLGLIAQYGLFNTVSKFSGTKSAN
jgi:hypothetical protein